MRHIIVAGNWKMNLNYEQATGLAAGVTDKLKASDTKGVEVILAPPFPFLVPVLDIVRDTDIRCAGQYCHHKPQGAHTGETSAPMIASCGASHVIVGHSERREAGETNEVILGQIREALSAGLRVIFCCGEPLAVRRDGRHELFVLEQLKQGVFQCNAEEFSQMDLAYEPIWAIGTGETATPDQAASMHHFIRSAVADRFNAAIAGDCRILYGGSCKPSNAEALFSKEDVDGGLIGGASLNAEDFYDIILAAASTR